MTSTFLLFLFKRENYKTKEGQYKTQYLTVENPTSEVLHIKYKYNIIRKKEIISSWRRHRRKKIITEEHLSDDLRKMRVATF